MFDELWRTTVKAISHNRDDIQKIYQSIGEAFDQAEAQYKQEQEQLKAELARREKYIENIDGLGDTFLLD